MSLATANKSAYRSKPVSAVSQRSAYALPLSIIAIFALACFTLAYYLNIWQDEAYSLNSSSGTVLHALRQGLGFEAQAPLYFVALAVWREINGSAFFSRTLSVAVSVVTLATTWFFARRYITGINPAFVLAAVALNPFIVWAALEIRPYAASITCSALLLFLFFRGFIDKDSQLAFRVAYLLVAIVGTYTQYYVAFLIPANFLALLALRRWASARSFAVYGIGLVLAILPLARVLPNQLNAYHAFAVVYRLPSYIMATVLLEYPFPHDWIGSWAHQPLLNVGYLALALMPLALALRHLHRLSTATVALLAMVGALFAMYTGAIAVLHVQVIVPRHTLVMLIPMLACCFALIGDLPMPHRRSVLFAYGLIYSLFAGASLWHDFHSLTKVGDWRRVAGFVAGASRTGDGIALFNAEAELPFRYYFSKSIPIDAIPRSMSFERFDEGAFVLHSRSDVARSFERFSRQHQRIWLIETDACTPRYAFFGCKYLNGYVAEHFRNVQQTRFDGATVLELQRRL